jgi:heterodisulfide reductase subunit B
MRFAYYPGCSLQATGRAYDESTRAVADMLGIELDELDDWNCCGATTYMSVRELLSVSISARNLSLAQRQGQDIVAPCSACFTVLRKTDHYLQELPVLRRRVGQLLDAPQGPRRQPAQGASGGPVLRLPDRPPEGRVRPSGVSHRA